MKSTRVLVVGVDGAPLRLISKWSEEGLLPTFRKIMEEGAFGPMTTTAYAHSVPAWISMFTGVNPGKHALHGLVDEKGRLVSSANLRRRTLWELLGDYGLTSVVINVPATYPIRKAGHSVIIPGLLAPEDFTTYPGWLKNILKKWDYRIGPISTERILFDRDKLVREMFRVAACRVRAAKSLLKSITWDLFIVIFYITDRAQHFFWHCMDQHHPYHKQSCCRRYKSVILDAFRFIDKFLGYVLQFVDERTILLVVSDHGMGPVYRVFYINEWLRLLGLHNKSASMFSRLSFIIHRMLGNIYLQSTVSSILRYTLPYKLYSAFYKRARKDHQDAMVEEKSIAYFSPQKNGVVVNVADDRMRERLINKLITWLNNIRDNGRRVVKAVLRREKACWGDFVHLAPDLYVIAEDGYDICAEVNGLSMLFGPPLSGLALYTADHVYQRQDGIFMVYNPYLVEPCRLEKVSIFDVTPTILYAMGLPIPSYMDGEPLTRVFKFRRKVYRLARPRITKEKLRMMLRSLRTRLSRA